MDESLKIIVVGKHCTHKSDIAEMLLKEYNTKIGKLFTSSESVATNLNKNHKHLTKDQVQQMHKNGFFLFMDLYIKDGQQFFVGLDMQEFFDNNVFFINSSYLSLIPDQYYQNYNVLIIWLDQSDSKRISTYNRTNKIYKWNETELLENQEISDRSFLKVIDSNKHLYFFNEVPDRVGCIINTLLQYPNEVNSFVKHFS